MFGKIYLRLYFWFLLVFVLTIAVVSFMFHSFYAGRVHDELGEQIESHAQFLTAEYEDACRDSASASCRNFLDRIGKVRPLHFWIVDPSGSKVFLSNERYDPPPLSVRDLSRAQSGNTVVSMRRRTPPIVVVPLKSENGSVQHLAIVQRGLIMQRFPRFPVFASLILVLITIAVLILPLSKRLTKRVRELHRLGEEWSEGHLEKRASVTGTDEISDLSKALNTMAANLQVMLEHRKEFLAWISHQLKSPLARMRIALEMLSENNAQPETTTLVKNIEWEIEESEKLIEQLLILSKIEMNVPSVQESVQVEKVVSRAFEQTRSRAENAGVFLNRSGSGVVAGDFYQLETAISNILENAIKFSEKGGKVEVDIVPDGNRVLIRCKDEGSGIEVTERQKIFEPFFRGTAGRQKNGTGLGLYIARRIVEMHGGNIRAEAGQPNGTQIVISLPKS